MASLHVGARALRALAPELTPALYKGQCGKVAVLGGCGDYTGAPFYAAMAALHAGADLAYVLCAPSAAVPIKSYSPELIVLPLLRESGPCDAKEDFASQGGAEAREEETQRASEGAAARIAEVFPRLSALVVGPGLGRDPLVMATAASVIRRARAANLPLVVDGDGLYLVAQDLSLVRGYGPCILTANGIEFSRLWAAAAPRAEGCAPFELRAWTRGEAAQRAGGHALALARALDGPTVLQKGSADRAAAAAAAAAAPGAAGGEVVVDVPGCPRRCGGQGDVLAGVAGTALSWASRLGGSAVEGLPAGVAAAVAAAHVTRRCGQRAFEAHKRGTTAPHLLAEVAAVVEEASPAGRGATGSS